MALERVAGREKILTYSLYGAVLLWGNAEK
jgi:hypothetical protein